MPMRQRQEIQEVLRQVTPPLGRAWAVVGEAFEGSSIFVCRSGSDNEGVKGWARVPWQGLR